MCIYKNLLSFIMLFFLSLYLYAQSETSNDDTDVSFHVKHGQMMQNAEPGFFIIINKLTPNKNLSIYLVDSEGSQFTIVDESQEIRTDSNGDIWLDIPYLIYNWSSGPCVILASDTTSVHYLETELPKITYPTEANPKWGLQFHRTP